MSHGLAAGFAESRRWSDSQDEHRFVRSYRLAVSTRARLELLNLTGRLAAVVRASGVRDGLAVLSSLHTTTALFLNEWQPALLTDIQRFLEQLVPRDRHYRHNDPRFSDCERSNADAHLRALLLGHQLVLPIQAGTLALGPFQAVILAELDGPRQRNLQLQILG